MWTDIHIHMLRFLFLAGADLEEEDGIYSRYFYQYDEDGVYSVRVFASGEDENVKIVRESRQLYADTDSEGWKG